MSFDFGGPKFRSFDILGLLQGIEFVVRYGWLAYKHRYAIMAFLRRNHRVISALIATSLATFLAGSFVVGSAEIIVGKVQMHIALSGMVTVAAVGFTTIASFGVNEVKNEWRHRPEPTPVGSD